MMMKRKAKNLCTLSALFLLLVSGTVLAQMGGETVQTPEAFLKQGHQLLESDRPDEALQRFDEGLAAFPGNPDLMVGAGRAALLNGDTASSVAYLFEAVGAAPDSYEANFHLARALRLQGQEMADDLMTQNDGYMMIEDALGFFKKAVELDPKSPVPCLELGYTYYWLDDLEKADDAARSALERSPDFVEALLLRGDLGYSKFRQAGAEGLAADEVRTIWREAMALYRRALEIDPENSSTYLGIAALYEADKKWKESAEAYREAIVRNPELLHGYNRLITIFNREEAAEEEPGEEKASLGDYVEEILTRIEKRYPGEKQRTATPLYYLGFARFLEMDFEGSIEAFKASTAINEQYKTGASFYIARACYELGEKDKSLELFLALKEKDPEGLTYFLENDNRLISEVVPSLQGLAYDCFQQGRMKEARELNAVMLMAVKNNASLFNDYAFLCRETGAYEQSFEAYLRALELDPTNPSYLNDAALILHYHLHRDLESAESMYSQAIMEAEKILKGESEREFDEEEARIALRDATNNLRRLKRGIMEDPVEGEKEDDASD